MNCHADSRAVRLTAGWYSTVTPPHRDGDHTPAIFIPEWPFSVCTNCLGHLFELRRERFGVLRLCAAVFLRAEPAGVFGFRLDGRS